MKEVSLATLEEAKRGNLSAMEEIYKNYSGFVFRNALRITGSPEDADEVTQEVFIKVLKNFNNFKFNSSLSTYLYRITINTAINYTKSQKTKQIQNTENSVLEPIDNNNTEEELTKRELHDLFFRIMNSLGDEMRECFYLKEVEGMKYEEIATLLNENVNTVKTKVRRARERLINELKEFENELQRG